MEEQNPVLRDPYANPVLVRPPVRPRPVRPPPSANPQVQAPQQPATAPKGGSSSRRRTAKIGPLKKGELKAVGYSATAKVSGRHRALTKAIKRYGPLSTYRKLNAVAVYTKRTAPAASKTFKADRNWVGRKAGYKH